LQQKKKASSKLQATDALVWQSLNHTFCSYKSKVATQNFCRHDMNVTGLCNKSACPLANSRYATIKEERGLCYLYEKVPELQRYPKKMWRKTQLPRNYAKALAHVTEELQYYPKYVQHRSKQRLTRIHQYLIRMRKLAMKTRPKVVAVTNAKSDKRENRKEAKALAAAKVNESITKELLNRLKEGTYGDIYNFPALQYNTALDEAQVQSVDAAMDREDDDDAMVHFVEGDFDDDDDDDIEELEPDHLRPKGLLTTTPDDDDDDDDARGKKRRNLLSPSSSSKKKKTQIAPPRPKRRVEIEYDDDEEELAAPLVA